VDECLASVAQEVLRLLPGVEIGAGIGGGFAATGTDAPETGCA
jgi:hypothetical protein